jgi:hypothetical protein
LPYQALVSGTAKSTLGRGERRWDRIGAVHASDVCQFRDMATQSKRVLKCSHNLPNLSPPVMVGHRPPNLTWPRRLQEGGNQSCPEASIPGLAVRIEQLRFGVSEYVVKGCVLVVIFGSRGFRPCSAPDVAGGIGRCRRRKDALLTLLEWTVPLYRLMSRLAAKGAILPPNDPPLSRKDGSGVYSSET